MSGQDIVTSLNVVSEKLFKNVEGQAYEILDKITCIDKGIIKTEPLSVFLSEDKIYVMSTIAKTLIMIYIIYYIIMRMISAYNGEVSENIYVFIIKLIMISLLINYSYYICESILDIFGLITESINEILTKIAGKEPTFVNLRDSILSLDEITKSEFLSVEGLIKSFFTFGIVNMVIIFSVRYVKVIFFIIVSPFCFCFLSNEITKGIFNNWIKEFVAILSLQIFVKIIIAIPIMYKDTDSLMYKIILVGTIYIIYKLNDFVNSIAQNINFLVKR